jgi:hypothetical protein
MLISVAAFSGSAASAHSKERRQQLSKLDERKIVDNTLVMLISADSQRTIYFPEEITFTLEDMIDYMIEGNKIHQYARAYVARQALDKIEVSSKNKSKRDFELILRYVGHTLIWSSDSFVGAFTSFMNNTGVPLELRMKALLFALKSADEELIKMAALPRENRRKQLNAMQKALIGGYEIDDFGKDLGDLKAQIQAVAKAVTERYCGEILARGGSPE